MRNQLLRDADWASMAHSLEVRVPFLDSKLLDRLGPAIASHAPPTKADLGACADQLPHVADGRRKTGFTTPVGAWIDADAGRVRGMRGWAGRVHRSFRAAAPVEVPSLSMAAE
jgi:asparagine synthase (glutamine-hydrolysing)